MNVDKNAERAEKIANRWMNHPDNIQDMTDEIKQALDEAVEDQRERDHMPGGPCCIALDRAKREGLEMAAGIAKNFDWCGETCCGDGQAIAGLIEAKAREII